MHYLDHAATTPVLPEVKEAMLAFLGEDFGNPSSVHRAGRKAKEAVEDARERVAHAVGASPSEIVFTGGGTEADNLAIKGAVRKLRGNGDHVVLTTFEHHAVLDTASWIHSNSVDLSLVPVGSDGIVDPQLVADAVRPGTMLVSVMTVNNELGTIQPISEIVTAVKDVNPNTLVHTDAVQALGNLPVDVTAWGVDLAAFAAHKHGGPKGVGALFVRAGVPVEPLIHGGGQERGLRSGTLNVPGIAGAGIAAEIAAKETGYKKDTITPLREALWDGISAAFPDAQLNGHPDARIPGTLNVSIPGTEGETLILLLDREDIACSAGSACGSGAIEASHVLTAIGVPKQLAIGSLRFSFGRSSTMDDVDAVLAVLPEVVAKARRAA